MIAVLDAAAPVDDVDSLFDRELLLFRGFLGDKTLLLVWPSSSPIILLLLLLLLLLATSLLGVTLRNGLKLIRGDGVTERAGEAFTTYDDRVVDAAVGVVVISDGAVAAIDVLRECGGLLPTDDLLDGVLAFDNDAVDDAPALKATSNGDERRRCRPPPPPPCVCAKSPQLSSSSDDNRMASGNSPIPSSSSVSLSPCTSRSTSPANPELIFANFELIYKQAFIYI